MVEYFCQKCRGRLIPDPERLDSFMCGSCGRKHKTVFGTDTVPAGIG